MKKYYLVKVRFDDERFPFRNQVFEAESEEHAIEIYHKQWRSADASPITSIEAEYLGIMENVSMFIERMIGRFYLLLSIPHHFLIMFYLSFVHIFGRKDDV